MAIEKFAKGFKINNEEVGISSSLTATYDISGTNIASQFEKIIHPNVAMLLEEDKTMDVDDILSVDVSGYNSLEIEYTNAINDCYTYKIDMDTITTGQDNEKAINNVCYNVDSMIVDTLKYYFTEETETMEDEETTKLMFNLYPSNNEGTNLVINQIYAKNYKI